jgi:hypothetical protein
MPKMGRPVLQIDWEALDSLCRIHCTLSEIASVMNISEDTIERAVRKHHKMHFAEFYRQKAGAGKMSLRRAMWKKAIGSEKEKIPPDNTMMIWLSKNHLNMTEKMESRIQAEHSGPEGKPIEVVSVQEKVKRIISAPDGLELLDKLEKLSNGTG